MGVWKCGFNSATLSPPPYTELGSNIADFRNFTENFRKHGHFQELNEAATRSD
jgi:hypothetical protein